MAENPLSWGAALASAFAVLGCHGSGGTRGHDAGPSEDSAKSASKDNGLLRCGAVDAGWCLMDPPYRSVWENAVDDVWVVESDFQETTARHWDGSTWNTFSPGTNSALAALWGSANGDLWAVGSRGAIVHWDGQAWTPVPAATNVDLTSIWGSSPTDVWAVGGPAGSAFPATALHWDGGQWTPVPCPSAPAGSQQSLVAVWASAADDAWAVGEQSPGSGGASSAYAIHWDGAAWTQASIGADVPFFSSVWGSGRSDIWFGGAGRIDHLSAGMVTSERIVGTTASLWGSGVDDVWAVGGSGSIRHWDGSTWTPVASGTSSDLTGVSGHGAADVWAVGPAGTVVNWNGASWGSVAEGSIGPLSAVWGRAPDDVWTGGPLHWNGRAWTAPSDDSNIEALAFCGFSPGDVWAVGQDLVAGNGTGTIAHWDGASWTVEGIAGVSAPNATVLGPSEMRAVWCHSPSDVWAVGKITALTGPLVDTIARWDGSSWSPVDNPTAEPLTGIWGTDGNDIWAAGDQGALVHWDGSSWTPIQSATVADLGAVWGSGSEDVWVIAKGTGFMEHWDGRAWTLVSDGTTGATLLSLWGVLPGDVWAAGMLGTSAGGVVSHWDGRAWSTVWKVPGEVPRFTGIWGSAGEIFLVAENGMIFSRR